MTLWDLNKNQNAVVTSVEENLSATLNQRLQEMGLCSGQSVQCLQRGPFNGPLVVQLGGTAFAVEQALAQRILVQPS